MVDKREKNMGTRERVVQEQEERDTRRKRERKQRKSNEQK